MRYAERLAAVDIATTEIVAETDTAISDRRRLRRTVAAVQHQIARATIGAVKLRPDPRARYETVDKVLAMAKRLGVARMGFVGNERYARF